MDAKLQDFYKAQIAELKSVLMDAVETYDALNSFVNLRIAPPDLDEGTKKSLGFPIRSDMDLLDRAYPVLYAMGGRLATCGTRLRDITAWRRSRALGLNPASTEQPVSSSEGPGQETRFEKLKSIPGKILNFASPAPMVEGEEVLAVVDPFESFADVVSSCLRRMRLNHSQGTAADCMTELREVVAKRLPTAIRDVQTYTNELIMETGDQVAVIEK